MRQLNERFPGQVCAESPSFSVIAKIYYVDAVRDNLVPAHVPLGKGFSAENMAGTGFAQGRQMTKGTSVSAVSIPPKRPGFGVMLEKLVPLPILPCACDGDSLDDLGSIVRRSGQIRIWSCGSESWSVGEGLPAFGSL